MNNHKKEIWCIPCAFAQLQFKLTVYTPLNTSLQPSFTLTIYVSVEMWEDLDSSSENLVKVASATWFLQHGVMIPVFINLLSKLFVGLWD